jgi:hypothetical protein
LSTPKDPYQQHKSNTMKETLNSIDLASTMYNKNDLCKHNHLNKYPWYSMIHSLFEPFELIVYSESHLVKEENINVHEITKLKLQFPKGNNFDIIFKWKTST